MSLSLKTSQLLFLAEPSENVLITYEVFHYLKTYEVLHYLKTYAAKKMCSMAVKTDMNKAYDRFEWGFIQVVLERLGFHKIWVNWIMQCITSMFYSFLFNGTTKGCVLPTRGIRQEVLSHPIFSSYVLKFSQVYAKWLKKKGNYQVSEWQSKAPESSTYC